MKLELSEYLLLFASSLIFVGLLTPLARKVAKALNVVDSPSESHKTHKEPIPYLGGVAIIIGVSIITYTAIAVRGNSSAFALANTLLLPAILLGFIGLVDDIKKLAPLPRFIAQNAVAITISAILIVTDTLGSPSGNVVADFFITILWFVGITNSINFFDNVDGGASGTIAISSIFLFLLAFQGGQIFIAALAAVLGGATIGFLLWNRPPARIYMGDAGALFLGLLIATLLIRFNPNPIYLSASFAIPVLIMAIPILDTSVAVISRLRRGISPFQGGQDHLSHRLVRAGLSRRVAAVSLWSASGVCAATAVLVYQYPESLGSFLIATFAAAWLLALLLFLRTPSQD